MKNQAEFKALVEQKMKHQRQAARIRRQQWTASGASAGVLILVVGISFIFSKTLWNCPYYPRIISPTPRPNTLNKAAVGHPIKKMNKNHWVPKG